MTRAIWAGLLYFVAVFALGTLFGAFRVLWLAPRLGPTFAVALEMPVLLTCAWLVARRLVRPAEPGPRLLMGATAFGVLMLAETLMAMAFGQSLSEHLAHYREPDAILGLAGQMLFGLFPWLQTQTLRQRRSAASAAASYPSRRSDDTAPPQHGSRSER